MSQCVVASVFFTLATFVLSEVARNRIGVRSCEIESGRVTSGDVDSRRHFAFVVYFSGHTYLNLKVRQKFDPFQVF